MFGRKKGRAEPGVELFSDEQKGADAFLNESYPLVADPSHFNRYGRGELAHVRCRMPGDARGLQRDNLAKAVLMQAMTNAARKDVSATFSEHGSRHKVFPEVIRVTQQCLLAGRYSLEWEKCISGSNDRPLPFHRVILDGAQMTRTGVRSNLLITYLDISTSARTEKDRNKYPMDVVKQEVVAVAQSKGIVEALCLAVLFNLTENEIINLFSPHVSSIRENSSGGDVIPNAVLRVDKKRKLFALIHFLREQLMVVGKDGKLFPTFSLQSNEMILRFLSQNNWSVPQQIFNRRNVTDVVKSRVVFPCADEQLQWYLASQQLLPRDRNFLQRLIGMNSLDRQVTTRVITGYMVDVKSNVGIDV